MSYLTDAELQGVGFKKLGRGVKISDKASIYDAEKIEVGDYSRIDDFCIISGRVVIGRYNHITPMCLVAGGLPGIVFGDFCTLAYGVKVFAQSDDYTGETLTNSLVPKKFKNEYFSAVNLERHVIVGANSVIFPGVTVAGSDMEWRASAGVGLIWDSPFGPLRVDYAHPLKKQPGDDVQEFNFGMSTKF